MQNLQKGQNLRAIFPGETGMACKQRENRVGKFEQICKKTRAGGSCGPKRKVRAVEVPPDNFEYYGVDEYEYC